ncbi:oxygenase MpaB family protein [Blastomonas sp. AAP25]|uniref:oxygenase MpaB family protein n=1 Tax=Blastomonas sp. AAP25 TaxID=1523416 RepID=UPI001E628651|nr:oxygenase MpaB family protein [Blastomonas sp. AAP25]
MRRSPHIADMQTLRDSIGTEIRRIFAEPGGKVIEISRTDEGLFGVDSVCWQVHGDVTAMMIGGIASLLLQMLEPRVLAGVWDHSVFRQDIRGRLRRTAAFLARTTYGDKAQALGEIARIRRIHDHVRGTLPDGTPYEANDPQSLAWVHVTESLCFVESFIRYSRPHMSMRDRDRYFDEMAEVGTLLGADPVPRTYRAAQRFIRDARPTLRFDQRTREIADLLLNQPPASPRLAPFHHMTMQAGVDLLPGWARSMHGLSISLPARLAVRGGTTGMAAITRWALSQGSTTRSASASA